MRVMRTIAEKFSENVVSVSYTHLDVYKRQTPKSEPISTQEQGTLTNNNSEILQNSLIFGTPLENNFGLEDDLGNMENTGSFNLSLR